MCGRAPAPEPYKTPLGRPAWGERGQVPRRLVTAGMRGEGRQRRGHRLGPDPPLPGLRAHPGSASSGAPVPTAGILGESWCHQHLTLDSGLGPKATDGVHGHRNQETSPFARLRLPHYQSYPVQTSRFLLWGDQVARRAHMPTESLHSPAGRPSWPVPQGSLRPRATS